MTPTIDPATDKGAVSEIIAQLEKQAVGSSNAEKMIAEHKADRNRANGEPDSFYMWSEPEQTLEWRAAQALTRLQAGRDEAERVLRMAVVALEEAEAILGGEYGDHYSTLCNRMIELKDAAALLDKIRSK